MRLQFDGRSFVGRAVNCCFAVLMDVVFDLFCACQALFCFEHFCCYKNCSIMFLAFHSALCFYNVFESFRSR